jgi:NAD(P)-dependent dehydrogenase (short-subunit alcohol dehydrogenase family)
VSKDFDLTGKVCVVTGAGRGIGRGMAEGLARNGATVVLSGRTRATLEEAAAAIGDKAIVVTADVSREADVLALRDAVLQRCGHIDVLVNNAGVNAIFKGIERTTLAEWQDMIDVNLTGVFLCCKHLGGAIGEGGSVINVSSVAGHGGLPRSVPYCASKGGVEMLTKALAGLGKAQGAGEHAGPRLGRHRPDTRIAGARRAWQALAGPHTTRPVRDAAGHGRRCGVPRKRRLGLHDRAKPCHRWRLGGGVGVHGPSAISASSSPGHGGMVTATAASGSSLVQRN